MKSSAAQSNFNDGKVLLCFTPLLLPLANGKKCWKNAKATPKNRVFFIHKDQMLENLVDKAIESIKKTNKLAYCIGNRSGLFTGDNFTLKYMINCTDLKDIEVASLTDFANLIDEIKQLNRPVAGFKLFINEQQVSTHAHGTSPDLKLMDSLHQEHGEDDDEESDQDDQENLTKKKVCMLLVVNTVREMLIFLTQNSGPTPKELSQNEDIARLTQMYACEDRSCKFTTCYLMPPDATHVHLTHLYLNTWAAAIVSINLIVLHLGADSRRELKKMVLTSNIHQILSSSIRLSMIPMTLPFSHAVIY